VSFVTACDFLVGGDWLTEGKRIVGLEVGLMSSTSLIRSEDLKWRDLVYRIAL